MIVAFQAIVMTAIVIYLFEEWRQSRPFSK